MGNLLDKYTDKMSKEADSVAYDGKIEKGMEGNKDCHSIWGVYIVYFRSPMGQSAWTVPCFNSVLFTGQKFLKNSVKLFLKTF